MNEKQIQALVKDAAEQKAPAAAIDLWPAIRTRLAENAPASGKAARQPRIISRPQLRLAALVAITLLLAGAVFLALPQGQAWAQDILRFFTRSQSDVQVLPTPIVNLVAVTPGQSAPTLVPAQNLAFETECGPVVAPVCLPDQIQSRVSFPIMVLTSLPEGLQFNGITGGPERVYLQYSYGPHTGGVLLTESLPNLETEIPSVGESADIQAVNINGASGELVQGGWETSAEGAIWRTDAGLITLRWSTAETSYSLSAFGDDFRPEDLIDLAESLGAAAVSNAAIPPTPDTTKFKDEQAVESLAGFDVHTPSSFFPDYKRTHYSFSPKTNSVCLHYLYAPLEFEFHPVAYLVQSPITDEPADFGAGATAVVLEKADGGQGWLAFQPPGAIPACENASFWGGMALRWQQQGMLYQLYAATNPMGAGYISDGDLVAMANQLTGAASAAAGALDPMNLKTLADAEKLAGFPVRGPSLLPAGEAFSHAIYNPQTTRLTLVFRGFYIHSANTAADPLLLCETTIPSTELQPVLVNGSPAQYAQGEWRDGWDQSISAEYLAWQADGISYCIEAGFSIPTAQATMIQIAESMK